MVVDRSANPWSNALTRGGARQWIGINDSSDPGASAAWFGFSTPASVGLGVVVDGAVSLTVPESALFGEHRFAL